MCGVVGVFGMWWGRSIWYVVWYEYLGCGGVGVFGV